MEDFVVSARKYRPQTFDSVVGQSSITNTLIKAIENNHLAQSFLFCGPRGVGKTTCARILAKTINQKSTENVSDDEDFAFNIFELDAASNNSVDDMRSLIEQVRYAPQVGKYKVYIIDEAHMLSPAAFNAFLKTLEEPPSYAIFILATTEKHKIIPTILSRCQIFDFKRIQISDMVDHLAGIAKKEGIKADSDALHIIAQKADGALRDALSIFDQIVSFTGNHITYDAVIDNLNILDYDYYFRIMDSVKQQNIPSVLLAFDEIINKGFDGHNFLVGLASHCRNLMVCKTPQTLKLLEVGENIKERYTKQATALGLDILLQSLKLLNQADVNYKSSKNQRLLVELALMQMCSLHNEVNEKKNDSPPIAKPNIEHTRFADSVAPKELPKAAVEQSPELNVDPAPLEAKTPTKKEYAETIAHDPDEIIPDKEESKVEEIIPELKTPDTTEKKTLNTDSVKTVQKGISNGFKSRLGSIRFTEGVSLSEMAREEEVLVAEEENLEEQLYNDKPKDDFSQQFLMKVWKEYCQTVKEDERQSIYVSLTKREPILQENFNIQLLLDNDIQLQDLNLEKPNLMEHLRSKLNNWSISLEGIVEEEAGDDLHLYTSREKFEAMVAKNPVLGKLAKSFNLDPDFE